jgi:hypothetical protein
MFGHFVLVACRIFIGLATHRKGSAFDQNHFAKFLLLRLRNGGRDNAKAGNYSNDT